MMHEKMMAGYQSHKFCELRKVNDINFKVHRTKNFQS